jgi:hypothetical protein
MFLIYFTPFADPFTPKGEIIAYSIVSGSPFRESEGNRAVLAMNVYSYLSLPK